MNQELGSSSWGDTKAESNEPKHPTRNAIVFIIPGLDGTIERLPLLRVAPSEVVLYAA
jgi:hypothetical protein